MDTFLELQTAIQSDMTIGSESTMYPLATVKLSINRAYRKAGGLFRWPELEDAKKTSTIASQEYYDYPSTWRPDSVWKLVVNDIDYGDPVLFKDYLYEKEEDIPSGLEYLWSNQWRRFFIYPTPTTNGNNNIHIWGVKNVETLVNDGDTTIFSYSLPECNEALILEATAILKSKGEDEKSGAFKSAEAKQILATAWNKIKQEQGKYEKTQPFFNVDDFFGGNVRSSRQGNF